MYYVITKNKFTHSSCLYVLIGLWCLQGLAKPLVIKWKDHICNLIEKLCTLHIVLTRACLLCVVKIWRNLSLE